MGTFLYTVAGIATFIWLYKRIETKVDNVIMAVLLSALWPMTVVVAFFDWLFKL